MWLGHVSVSLAVVYLGFYLVIVFLSLSVATGLYYLAELIEEFTITTKKLITLAVKAELALHALLLIDRLPVLCLGLGVASHLCYNRLLARFPYISLTSQDALLSMVGLVASTAAWGNHFWKRHYTVEYIVAFLVVTTWLVPFIYFLSMAGDQAVLPGAGGYPYASPSSSPVRTVSGRDMSAGGQKPQRQRRTVLLRVFDALRRKRDAVLPDVVGRFPASSAILKESIA